MRRTFAELINTSRQLLRIIKVTAATFRVVKMLRRVIDWRTAKPARAAKANHTSMVHVGRVLNGMVL